MGDFNCRNGLQTGISSETNVQWSEENNSIQNEYRHFYGRNKHFVRKRRYRKSTFSSESQRFLQHLISSSQEMREIKNGHESETIEWSFKKDSFQNGLNDKSNQSSQTKRLGDISRSFRCISTCTTVSKSQKIHEILYTKPMLSVENSLFRTNVCSKSVHKNSNSSSSVFEKTKHQTSSLSGRLVDSKSRQKSTSERSSEMSRSFSFSGVYNKQREIQFDTQSTIDLSRGPISFGQGVNFSDRGTDYQTPNVDSENVSRGNDSIRFSENFGCNGFLHRISTKCTSPHETNTTTFVKFLESNEQGYEYQNPIYTTSEIASNLVVRFSEHAERPVFNVPSKYNYGHHGCFEKRLRWAPWESYIPRGVDRGTETLAYKLSRNESCLPDSETFSESTEEQVCSNQKRQYQHSPIYMSTGGDKIAQTMLFNMGTVANGLGEQHNSQSSSYSWNPEHSGGPTESKENSTSRMDTESISSSTDFSEMGVSYNRPICIQGEQTDGSILLLDSPSRCISNGCSDDIMGRDVCIRIPSDLHDSQDIKIYEAIPVSDDTNSTTVAEETLVCRPITNVDCSTNSTSELGESVESTQNEDLPSKSSNVELDSVAPLHRNFKAEGFSEQARNLLSASWRKGTQNDYSKKFDKFNSWCNERQIDPYRATLNQIADFLAYLFESGLQYSTISGYRSMLSAVLPQVDNHQVGQHPYISRLLKGVFHSRPPRTKLLPEWDLDLVLETLEAKPFEPMKDASLKFVTLKTVFMIAITTFRRCSDIQSLRIDHQSMRIQKKGITFIRHGLSKQDRQSHYGVKIQVPHYPEKELLDPKRAITHYLERTKDFRQNLKDNEKSKLFLALNSPHKPVTTGTISKWIVEVVKFAYSGESLSVRAHSTRAIAPTWALYNGATTKSILDAADWSSESTFVKHYLRDMEIPEV